MKKAPFYGSFILSYEDLLGNGFIEIELLQKSEATIIGNGRRYIPALWAVTAPNYAVRNIIAKTGCSYDRKRSEIYPGVVIDEVQTKAKRTGMVY